MTQEEKQLLLIDLSARLPYGVKCNVNGKVKTLTEIGMYGCRFDGNDAFYGWDSEDIKPFLRPMSDMTETEKVDLINSLHDIALATRSYICSLTANEPSMEEKIAEIDYLNEHMFDYRGLIEKGPALEAPKGMYNFEEEED